MTTVVIHLITGLFSPPSLAFRILVPYCLGKLRVCLEYA